MCLPMGNNGIIKYTLKVKKPLKRTEKKIFQMVTKYIILIFIGCDQKCSKLWNYINSLLLLFFDRCLQIPFWNIQNNKKFFLK